MDISIHAPSRERHYELTLACPAVEISIHAPSRERPIIDRFDDYCYLISIHAPSRERLTRSSCISTSTINFNPRSLAGATWIGTRHLLFSIFQSTLPRGSDGTGKLYYFPKEHFNPRSLAGATAESVHLIKNYKSISIHAPSRERQNLFFVWLAVPLFQSTLPRGSD